MNELIILVTGSRTLADGRELVRQLEMLPLAAIILHGAARGADRIAETWCAENGRLCIGVPADWVRYGKKAGVIRNAEMLRKYQPHGFLAFHDKDTLEESRGTWDMVQRCLKAGLPGRVFGKDTRLRDRLKWRSEPFIPEEGTQRASTP